MNNNPYLNNLGFMGTPGVQSMPPQGANSPPPPWQAPMPKPPKMDGQGWMGGPHAGMGQFGGPMYGTTGDPVYSPQGGMSGPMQFNTGGTQAYQPPMGNMGQIGGVLGGGYQLPGGQMDGSRPRGLLGGY
jgi:hypothetical protein